MCAHQTINRVTVRQNESCPETVMGKSQIKSQVQITNHWQK